MDTTFFRIKLVSFAKQCFPRKTVHFGNKHFVFNISISLSLPFQSTLLFTFTVLCFLQQRQHSSTGDKEEKDTHLALVIHSHDAPLQSEPQHHDLPGDPAGGSSGAVLRLVCPAQPLRLHPLKWQSSRAVVVVVAIRLIVPGSGVQSTPICLLSYGARLACVDQTAEAQCESSPNGCEGSIA